MKITNFTNEKELDNLKKFGIYKIYTIFSEECYIGSTSRCFKHRWQQHLTDLRNHKHTNSALQNVVNKYGLSSLIFEIVEITSEKENLIKREQYWIDTYNSYKNGFNCKPFADSSLGVIKSEETISKFYKEVSQYSMDGHFICTYKSLKDASEKTGTNYITLSNACNGKTKLANSYQWRFGNSTKDIEPVRPKSNKNVLQYDDNNNVLNEFLSLKDASKIINKAPNTLSTAISRNVKCGGFYWKFK